MKKILLIMLVLGLTLGFTTGCSKKEEPKKTEDVKDAGKDKAAETKTEPAKTGGNEVDAWLNDYEKIINEVTELTKKSLGGDMEAAKQMESLNPKLVEFQKKSAEIGPKMTPEQAERMLKIASKYMEVLGK